MSQAISPPKTVSSVCPYCGVGCGLLIESDGTRVIKVSGDKNHPSNKGRLCTKGQTSAQALVNSGRMESAFVRSERRHEPVKTPMVQAIKATAQRLNAVLEKDGPNALAFYVSGQMSIESQYLINKLAKGFVGTNNIESNSRLCMASAGAGYKLSLGSDAPPGSYDDFDKTDLFLVIGANMADCHPILYLRMMDRVKAGAKLIVVDPRRTTTAEKADLFLAIKPGTDLALLNGLLHLLVKNGQINTEFIARHTQGWEAIPALLADYPPEKVSELTGIAVADLIKAADMIGAAPEFITCWTMGLNQSTHGTWNTNAICNLHLATGKICRPGSGPFSLTGQPNAMGGREMGYMGPGLPGQRTVLVEADREFVEAIWELPAGSLSTQLGKGTVDMFERMAAGEIKACWVICTNPVASVPNRQKVIAGLQKAELVIAQDAFLETETNRYADILLPGALWAEAEGVMINSERNLTLMQQAVNPPGEAMADWEIIARVACEMGFSQGFNFNSAAEVFDEIKRFYNPQTGYDLRGVSHARLRQSPLQWPCAEDASERNPIRYLNNGINQPLKMDDQGKPDLVFATASGKAQFHARPHVDAEEMPDAEFPMVLNTGRVQHQWHTLTKTGKIPTLNKLNPGTFVEIHPQDAAELGINNKDKVEIRSRRGYAVLPAVVTDRVMPGCCFAPIHWNDVYGDNLCINAVTSDKIDAISQQPELKIAAVALKRIETINTSEAIDTSEAIIENAVPSKTGGKMVFAAPSEETTMTLIAQLADTLGVAQLAPPELNSAERSYLGGFINGLQTTARQLSAIPVLPADAPVAELKRDWINGLLAGMFSRVLPADVQSTESLPQLTLLWASQTGNAEALAQGFAAQLEAQGIAAKLVSMNDYSLAQLTGERQLVLVTSTFGDGDSPDNGGDFWHQLSSDDAPRLESLEFALLALGDSNYEQFCGHGKKLFARLETLGAKALLPRLDCDTDFEAPAQAWFEQLKPLLAAKLTSENSTSSRIAAKISVPMTTPAGDLASKSVPGFNKNNPYGSRLVINQKLNAPGSAKDVRAFGFDLGDSAIQYQAGDALGVWPQNNPEYVFELEQLLKLKADAPVLVDTQEKPLHLALQQNFEICRPSIEMLRMIAERGNAAELKAMLEAESKKELNDWLYGRQLVDVLAQFPINCSAQELLAQLKRIQPRMYSISSSPKALPGRIDLTVSAVRYSRFSNGVKKQRTGVCSTFLADRAEGVEVPIFVQPSKHFHLPENGDTPVIMVGPGTGVAPFRGFLQERQALGHQGKNWLFFGEQHAASDFYYREELEQYQRDGLLTQLSLAFSRDQAQKIYVQDRMRENAAELWEWLQQGAYFYVCGDATRMAKDVDQALRDIIQHCGKFDENETVNYMRKLNMEKRYLRDVY